MSMPTLETSPFFSTRCSLGRMMRMLSTRPVATPRTRTSLKSPCRESAVCRVSTSSTGSSGAYRPETTAATSPPRRRNVAADDPSHVPSSQLAVAICSGAGSRSRTNSAGAPRRAIRFENALLRSALDS